MREAIGQTFIFNLVILFVVIIMFLLVGSLSYTKAFRVKNRIVEILEKYKDYDYYEAEIKEEINANLKSIGYKTNKYGTQKCKANGGEILTDYANYRYCIVRYNNQASSEYYRNPKGIYYGVTAYMYFEIPLVNDILEFPIYGETTVMYNMVY